jgi:DNA-directed RNA polymerase specialized sigma24 family protein
VSIDQTKIAAVYTRLVAGDPSASADLIEMAYPRLIGYALKRHGIFGVDRDLARDLALKALADLIERPEQFDPGKGSLFGFLCMVVSRDAINAREMEKKRAEKFSQHAVAVLKVGGNFYQTTAEIRMDAQRIMEKHGSEIIVNEGDKEVLSLFLQEERDYAAYARVLGIEHLAPEERDAEVKRRKDRIEMRLKRLGRRL